ARDLELVGRLDDAARARRLSEKTRHNVATMLMTLGRRFVVEVLALYALTLVDDVYGWGNLWAVSAATAIVFAAVLGLDILIERASYGFRRMKPLMATSYDRAFWEVERYWKLSGAGLTSVSSLFAGTPFRPLVLRLAGVRIGRCVFDDGVNMSERTLVEIG